MRNGLLTLVFIALMLPLSSCEQKQGDRPKAAVAKEQTAPKPADQKPAEPAAKEPAEKARQERETKVAPEAAGSVRPPAVAGQFYPADPKQLADVVDKFLDKVAQEEAKGKIIGLICPHAGYEFSGQVAAYSYHQIKGKHYDTVVLIGLGHRGSPGMVSVYPVGAYETPLGKVPVNSELAAKIMMDHADLIKYQEWADAPEHSLEVQLPFLQRVLKDFSIVPILVTECSLTECATVAKAVADACRGENVLLVASSDLSHYPAYEDAVRADKATRQSWLTMDPGKILALDREQMGEGINNLACAACGRDAIVTTIMAAKLLGADKVWLLEYANSGDVMGDRSRVVGYGAAVIYKSETPQKTEAPKPAPPALKAPPKKEEPPKADAGPASGTLSPEQRKKLLALARSIIETAVRQQPIPNVKLDDPALQEHRGAFVTIKNRHRAETLRGCIGNFVAHEPLYKVVQKMALASATQDTRFFGDQVTPEELKDIEIEISVLSPLTPIADPMKIELGKHGIYIINERVGAGGCFLPQVATETGWSKEEFLSHCARDKAGLPADAWKNDPDTKVLVFTAEVFGEKE